MFFFPVIHQAVRLPILTSALLAVGCLKVPSEESDASGSSTEVGSSGETTGEPTTMGEGVCGDGNVDVGEGCDDGNEGEGDACPSGAMGQCKGVAACGDGFVWAGMEGCDDGNGVDGDGCEADCVVTPAPSVCGDGVQEGAEGCDDGNDVEEDACPSGAVGQCKAVAGCGDGLLWAGMEGCDDGMSRRGMRARAGDGAVQGGGGVRGRVFVGGDGGV
jgi:cysteine-rich repeat protein